MRDTRFRMLLLKVYPGFLLQEVYILLSALKDSSLEF